MYYCLYEIRNILNDKIYVGVHKTKNLDGYMGSGKVIRNAIKKYGSENFTKTILETFEDATSMYAREKEVVTDEFLAREDTYNLRRGGTGGFDFINKNTLTTEDRRKNGRIGGLIGGRTVADKLLSDPIYRQTVSELRTKLAVAQQNEWFYGNKRNLAVLLSTTPKSINKRKETYLKIAHQQGLKNSQYGTCWIYNEHGNKKIKKDDLPQYLEIGYIKGRRINAVEV